MRVVDSIKKFGLEKAYDYLEKDPETNIPKVVSLLEKLDLTDAMARRLATVKEITENPENNWCQYIHNVWTDLDSGVLKQFFTNFVVNASFLGTKKMKAASEKYGCNIPWAILMDPTSACNLHCTGCWAAEYGNKLNLSLEELDSIIEQGKELGIHMFIYSGGEPLVRKKDIITLCEKHSDCEFLSFTNGTLIDEAFADEMLRAKNFVPAISVEGFEEATDSRRGDGTFKRVEKAMAILKERKLAFGISCCYTSKNYKSIGSEEYFDQMLAWGAKFCWLFTYMPVGHAAVPDLMVTAEQREFMYDQVRKFRQTKPLFTIDFWNDGEYVKGCIAGGRNYLHINANGDFEACAFIHYSNVNLHDHTLVDALKSPLFQAYQEAQPFNENHLRPCPLLDNPGALARIVEKSGAHSTDLEAPEDVNELTAKCVEKAEKWAVTADRIWACSQNCATCGVGSHTES